VSQRGLDQWHHLLAIAREAARHEGAAQFHGQAADVDHLELVGLATLQGAADVGGG